MNDYLKYKLDEEQNVIVEADEKYIVDLHALALVKHIL